MLHYVYVFKQGVITIRRTIFHIDVNSAFLSWTAVHLLSSKDNPYSVDLRLVPSIIGGDIEKRHGVVFAKSLPCREF